MENEEPKTAKGSINQCSDEEPLFPNETVKIRKCPVTIEPCVLGIFLADSLADAVTTNLIVSRTCEVHFGINKSVCGALGNQKANESDVEALVQPYSAVIITSMSFLSVFFPAIMSLFVGSWSDQNGRKLVLIVPAIGYFFKFIILGIFSFFPTLSPEWALISILPAALSGGIVNFIFASYTYISDISQEDKRSFRIGVLESFMTFGSIIGLLSSAPVYNAGGEYGYVAVYGLCASVILIVTIPTCFFVPDSIQKSETGKGVMHVFELKLFKEMVEVCFKRREKYRRAVIFLAITSLTISICVMVGQGDVMYLFIKLRFGWNVQKFTVFSSIELALNFIGVYLGLFFFKSLKIKDSIVCVITYALKCGAALYVFFIPPYQPLLLYFSGLINIFGGLCGPVARTILNKNVPKEDLGKVFALLSSSEAIFPLGVGPLYTVVYNSTIGILPGAFLLLTGSLYFICCVFFLIIFFIQKPMEQGEYNQVENDIG